MLSTHAEAIVEVLQTKFDKVSGKWTRCQWNKFFGTSKLLNVKGLCAQEASTAIESSRTMISDVVSGRVSVTELKKYSEALRLMYTHEYVEHGSAILNYLESVEAAAVQCERDALAIIQEFFILGECTEVDEGVAGLLKIKELAHAVVSSEARWKQGKKLWLEMGSYVLDLTDSLLQGWVPRILYDGELFGEYLVVTDEPRAVINFSTPAEFLTQNAKVRLSLSPDGYTYKGRAITDEEAITVI